MGQAYICAPSFAEAHRFAQEDLGLERGTYRPLTSAGTLKSGIRNVDLHLVPGWKARYDRFAIQSALRWTKMNVIDHAEALVESEPESSPKDPALQAEFEEFLAQASTEPWGAPAAPEETFERPPAFVVRVVPDSTPVPQHHIDMVARVLPKADEPEEPVRRRRRCKGCGALVEPDDVEAHRAECSAREGV